MAEERDDSSGHLQFYADGQQQKNYGYNRTVDEKQHNKDHRDAYRRDCLDRPVASVAHIRSDRRRAGDIRRDPRRRWRLPDDALNGFDGFSPQGLARVAGEAQLNICGPTIGALRGALCEFITPEVLDVLHMFRIVLQLTNQTIVVLVSIVAEGLLTLQDDHRHTAGFGLLEVLIYAF